MGSCQHVLIQEYVRLISGWCEWNKFSRNFISAVSLLDTGEPHKAYDRFVQFTASALEEPFLEKIILDAPRDELTVGERETQYYLKVIQLFEQHSALDCVIQFARMAMDQPDRLSPSQLAMFTRLCSPTIWSWNTIRTPITRSSTIRMNRGVAIACVSWWCDCSNGDALIC